MPSPTKHSRPVPVAQRVSRFSYAIRNIVAEARAVEARGVRVRYLNIGDPVAFGFPGYRPELLDGVPRLFPSTRFRFMEEEVFMWQDVQAHARRRDDLVGSFWSWLRGFDFEGYRLGQRVGWLTWARINPLVARAPRVVAAAREARRFARRIAPRT